MPDEPVLIAKLARSSGVTVATVRVYERRGLIAPLYRAPNGYKYYDASLQQPIRVFGAAMSLGLSLAEIGEIFCGAKPLAREPTPAEAREATANAIRVYRCHLQRMDQELGHLSAMRNLLLTRIEYCTNELAGPGPVRIGVPVTQQQRRRLPGRVEYVRP